MNDADWNARVQALVEADVPTEAQILALRDAAGDDPARLAELAFVTELASVVDASPSQPDAADQALARRTLAALDEPSVPASSPDRTRWGSIAGGLAAAAAVLVLTLALWPATDEPAGVDAPIAQAEPTTVTFASGRVTVGAHAAAAQMQVPEGATVTTSDGATCVSIDGGIDVCAAEQTTLQMAALRGPARRVEVAQGRAVARLDTQPAGQTFALSAAQLQAVAVGTIFSVEHDGDEIVAAVLQGQVEVRVAGEVVRLGVLEQVRLVDGHLQRGKVDAARRDADLQLLAPLPSPGTDTGFVAIAIDPPGTPVSIDGTIRGPSPIFAAVPTGVHRVDVGGSDGAGVSQNVEVQSGQTARWDLRLTEATVAATGEDTEGDADVPDEETTGEAPTEPAPDKAAPVPTVDELLAQARQYRQDDRWRDAANTYRKLIRLHGRTSAARNAWLSLGDIQLDQLSQPKAALASYRRYLSQGGGALAQEARYGQIRALRRLGDRAGERKAIDAFLDEHATSPRAANLRKRQAELAP